MMDIRVTDHSVTLGYPSIQCIAEMDDVQIEYYWSPDDGLIPELGTGYELRSLSEEQRKYIDRWSAAAYQIVFAGSGHL